MILLIKSLCPPILWSLLKRAKTHFKKEATVSEESILHEKAQETFSGLEVKNGPFQGMQYPGEEAVGSSFFPKVLGSYEKELHPILSKIFQRQYSAVVDIGCAEGYYAVGLGMKLNGAKVYAYDVNEKALELCKAMAELNGVMVELGGFCDSKTLSEMDLGSRALIFSDCEGYEQKLFNKKLAEELKDHDILMETHDFVDINITKEMLEAFSNSHQCTVIESVDDIIKAYSYDYSELESMSLKERHYILREQRPGVMRWIYAEAKP